MARGDVLLWMDRDLSLTNRPIGLLFCIGQNVRRGVAGFHFPCFTERVWTKRELADAMGATGGAEPSGRRAVGSGSWRNLAERKEWTVDEDREICRAGAP